MDCAISDTRYKSLDWKMIFRTQFISAFNCGYTARSPAVDRNIIAKNKTIMTPK